MAIYFVLISSILSISQKYEKYLIYQLLINLQFLSLTSDDYTGNTDTLILTPSAGTISTTTIYVRFGPTTGGVKLDSISHLSYGLPNLDTVRVSGTGAAPEMTVDNSTESFGSIIMHEYSDEVSYTVSAVFLTDNMIITAPTGFEITTTSGDYSGNTSEITLVPVGGTIASTPIYVRFAPVNEQYYSGNISHATTGLSTINKFVNGTGFHAPLYYVSADALGNEDGANWDNAFTSLASALIEVTSGDTIVVAKGTYIPSIFSRTETFEMVAGVKIFGGFEGTEEINLTTIENRDFETNETILSGDLYGNDEFVGNTENSYTVVLFDAWDAAFSSTTILDGFTISGGNSNGSSIEYYRGGGIYMQVGYIDDCSPTLRNLVIKDNTARHGGGIYMDGIVDSYSTNATTLENVQFIDNYAFYASSAGGGAIYMSAVPNSSCEPSLTDVTFINNSSAQNGGGIYMSGGYIGGPGIVSPTITNAIFYGSTCVTNWGTAVHINAQEGLADPVFNNVIFYGNDEVQIRSYATTGTESPSYNHCLITGSPSTSWDTEIGINNGGNIEGDPLFVDAENANVSVFDNSPVIGVGDAAYGSNIGYYQGVGLAAPEVLVVSGLTDFGTIEIGNSSAEQSFTVSGTDLIEDVVITPPVGFELTLTSGLGYINEITLSPTTGTIVTTTVYVRFTPTVIGDHSDNITVNSTGVAEQLIAVTAYAGGAPEISVISDQSICSSNDLFVGFTVTDDDLSTISFNVITTDEAVLPVANTSITGSDGTYSLNITPLNAGTVDVKVYVTDASLNTDSASFNLVIVPGPAISVDFSQITCANYNDAELVVSSTGGTGVITYQLNNWGYGSQTTFDGLWEGQYTIVAQDESGCTDTSDVYDVINPDYLYGSANLENPITCHNDNDAIITVQAYGGWENYEFSIDGETFQSDTSFENLGEGYYNIYVRDASGCYEYIYDIEIYNPEELILEDIYLTDSNGDSNGSISVYAYGGTYPIMYALNDSEYQMDSYFNYLTSGEYTVYVQDANGCSLSEVVNLYSSTGINSEILNVDLNVYPNPASDYIYFEVTQLPHDLDLIEIYNLNGQIQLILNKDEVSEGKIDVNNLTQGAYLLIFKLENEKVIFEKIIKNN